MTTEEKKTDTVSRAEFNAVVAERDKELSKRQEAQGELVDTNKKLSEYQKRGNLEDIDNLSTEVATLKSNMSSSESQIREESATKILELEGKLSTAQDTIFKVTTVKSFWDEQGTKFSPEARTLLENEVASQLGKTEEGTIFIKKKDGTPEYVDGTKLADASLLADRLLVKYPVLRSDKTLKGTMNGKSGTSTNGSGDDKPSFLPENMKDMSQGDLIKHFEKRATERFQKKD